MTRVAPLRYGVIFKKAFSQPHIFMAFVKDIIGIEIEIDKVETEKSFSPTIGGVDSRFDLFAEDKKNRIIVDIQHKRYYEHYDRFLHYHCTALIEQIKTSANYQPPMRVYTIVVLTSGDKHKTDVLVTDFRPKKADGTYVNETEHKIFYICPKYVNDETPEPYKEWLRAIEDSLDKKIDKSEYQREIIHEIINSIKEDKLTSKERTKMVNEYADERYVRDEKEKAEKNKAIEIAKNSLKQNIDISTIALITGLSVEEIKEIEREV